MAKTQITQQGSQQLPLTSDRFPDQRIINIKKHEPTNGYVPITLETDRGKIETRYYEAPNMQSGVIYVGGIGGDFDSPAQDLYRRLSETFKNEKISSLRLQFRDPADLNESAFDVLTGCQFLRSRNIHNLILVGHSFGGAVVINAGALWPEVVGVVALSTQSFGAEAAARLSPKSLLLIHGEQDEVLPSSCSAVVFRHAKEPKELRLINKGTHVLNEVADEVYQIVYQWILDRGQQK